MKLLKKSGALDTIGQDHIVKTKENALEMIVPNLDLTICSQCPQRVFRECDENKKKGHMPE